MHKRATTAPKLEPRRRTYTIPEVAELLGVSRNHAYAAAKTGAIPCVRVGRCMRVSDVALERLLACSPAEAPRRRLGEAVR